MPVEGIVRGLAREREGKSALTTAGRAFGVAVSARVMLKDQRGATALAALEKAIAAAFPEVATVGPAGVAGPSAHAPILLLDARREAERAVSMIAGAVAIGTGMRARDVVARFGDAARDHHVILYCAVGLRSAALAARVQDGLAAAGALSIANLSGGVFRWHNEGRPLVDAMGRATRAVHPYNRAWRRYLGDHLCD